jgi:hypothetical protein
VLTLYVVSLGLTLLSPAATKWKDTGTGELVEYDQRRDIFRFAREILSPKALSFLISQYTDILLSYFDLFFLIEEPSGMLVCMLTWEELEAGEMTLSPLPTHLFFFCVAVFLGKDTR